MEVKLLSWNSGLVDVRKLVMLAFKVSAGKVREHGLEYYLRRHEGDLSKWMLEGVRYPSVLEHVVFTFYIDGISRVTSHQLVRHRLASYTQESQRYSAVSRGYVVPQSIRDRGFEERFTRVVKESYDLYNEMVAAGVPYEDARYVLPQAVTTALMMTVNLRELLHIACLRLSKEAQWEIRDLISKMVDEVSKVLPEIKELINSYCGVER